VSLNSVVFCLVNNPDVYDRLCDKLQRPVIRNNEEQKIATNTYL